MDPSSVSLAISSGMTVGNHILSLLKGVAESTKALGKAEIVNKFIEIQLSMMDLLQKHQVLIEDNNKLRNKIHELEKEMKFKKAVEFHFDAYWTRKDDNTLDGPFSKIYWEQKEKLVRLRFKNKGNYGDDGICYQFMDFESTEFANIPENFIDESGLAPDIYRNQ